MCGWLMSNVRVYIVDDYPLVREGIRRLLEVDARIRIVGEADSGEIALDKIITSSPKVVLMDVNLPGMNGIETTRLLTSPTKSPDVELVRRPVSTRVLRRRGMRIHP